MAEERYNPISVGGYNLYHVVSAFQKYVRRGMEHEAMYFGTELLLSNWHKYAWYRIKVMASEDIGLADNNVCVQVDALNRTFNEFLNDKRTGAAQMVFCHAILIITRAKKSRIVDNLYCKHVDLRKFIHKPEIHDFCFDQFTDVGKRKKRGNDFFFDVSGKLENIPDDLLEEENRIKEEVQMMYQVKDSGGKIIVNDPNKNLFENE